MFGFVRLYFIRLCTEIEILYVLHLCCIYKLIDKHTIIEILDQFCAVSLLTEFINILENYF